MPPAGLRAGAVVRYRGSGPNLLVAQVMGVTTAVVECPGDGVKNIEILELPTNELVQVLASESGFVGKPAS